MSQRFVTCNVLVPHSGMDGEREPGVSELFFNCDVFFDLYLSVTHIFNKKLACSISCLCNFWVSHFKYWPWTKEKIGQEEWMLWGIVKIFKTRLISWPISGFLQDYLIPKHRDIDNFIFISMIHLLPSSVLHNLFTLCVGFTRYTSRNSVWCRAETVVVPSSCKSATTMYTLS